MKAALIAVLALIVFLADGDASESMVDSFGPIPEARIPWKATHENDGWAAEWWCDTSGCRFALSATVAPPEPVVAPVLIVPWRSPRNIVAAHFPGQGDYAYSVFWCESKLDPTAIGAAGERGIAQIHPIWFKVYGVPPADLEGQVAQAAVIVGDIGWAHWSCS